jgi:hypothetical protein
MSEYAECKQCGNAFYKDQPWKKICISCWKKNKNTPAKIEKSFDELSTLRDEVRRYREEAIFYKKNYFDVSERLRIMENDVAIPIDIMKRLILLCHPDKHGNSQASTTVTTWLLNKRK